MRRARQLSRIPPVKALKALHGKNMEALTPREDLTLEYFRMRGGKYGVAISIINDAEPAALTAAKSPTELKQVVADAGGLRVCVRSV